MIEVLKECSYNAYNREIKFKVNSSNYPQSVMLFRYFTSNCQMGSIALASSVGDIRPECEEPLFDLLKKYGPTTYLMDINVGVVKKVLKVFTRNGYSTISNNPYTNTTGSKMTIIMVRVNERLTPEDKDYINKIK